MHSVPFWTVLIFESKNSSRVRGMGLLVVSQRKKEEKIMNLRRQRVEVSKVFEITDGICYLLYSYSSLGFCSWSCSSLCYSVNTLLCFAYPNDVTSVVNHFTSLFLLLFIDFSLLIFAQFLPFVSLLLEWCPFEQSFLSCAFVIYSRSCLSSNTYICISLSHKLASL